MAAAHRVRLSPCLVPSRRAPLTLGPTVSPVLQHQLHLLRQQFASLSLSLRPATLARRADPSRFPSTSTARPSSSRGRSLPEQQRCRLEAPESDLYPSLTHSGIGQPFLINIGASGRCCHFRLPVALFPDADSRLLPLPPLLVGRSDQRRQHRHDHPGHPPDRPHGPPLHVRPLPIARRRSSCPLRLLTRPPRPGRLMYGAAVMVVCEFIVAIVSPAPRPRSLLDRGSRQR